MIKHTTLGEHVYEGIRQEIMTGKYLPGERLFLDAIAKRMGVSMTPVKEAFLMLEQEGLVVSVARKGTFVREITEKDIVEYYQLRLALESLAVDLICLDGAYLSHETADVMNAICDVQETLLKDGNAAQLVQEDDKFHRQLFLAGQNQLLMRIAATQQLTNILNLMQKTAVYLEEGKSFVTEHRRMVKMLQKGAADSVKSLLAMHMSVGETLMLKGVRLFTAK